MQTCKINILFLPYHNTGGHFINWSLYYICNQVTYLTKNGKVAVMGNTDPDTNRWHQFPAYMVNGLDNLKSTVATLKQLQDTQFVNLYLANLEMGDATNILFGTSLEGATQEQREQAIEHIIEDSKNMFLYCQEQQMPFVIFDYHTGDLLNIFYNNRFPLDWNGIKHPSANVLHDTFEKTFFSDTEKHFDSEIWDQREKLALILQTQKNLNITSWYDQRSPHLYYNTDDIWNDLPDVILEICKFLTLPVDQDKFNSWQLLWNKWRKNHQPYFSRHFDRIIDSIVNNHYMLLDRFNLNIFHEALIQHALITKHNLNLKTWQLEKFPTNTQDLHKLLEPNIHHL